MQSEDIILAFCYKGRRRDSYHLSYMLTCILHRKIAHKMYALHTFKSKVI